MFKFIANAYTKHYKNLLIFLAVCSILLFPFSIVEITQAPNDYLQGEYAKIMYVHVPAAWLALFWYTALTFCSIGFLITRNANLDFYSQAIAPLGRIFCLITLITGSIWGKPTWGTWWVWDARLTAVLILFFIYTAYISLRKSLEKDSKVSFVTAVFAIVGFVNIPIIKFSVELWNTLHQPSSFLKLSGPSIHATMLKPLLISTLNLLFFSCLLLLIKLRISYFKRKIYYRNILIESK